MSTNKFDSKGIECNCSSKMNALIMHLHKFMLYLSMGLLLSLYCYCLFLAFDSDNFDFWVLAGIVSTVLAGALFYTYRFKKWRFGSFFLTVIVLLSFSLFSPAIQCVWSALLTKNYPVVGCVSHNIMLS
jgi:peptidoglycan/LPS O-acetylase OafA/YrhL